MNNEELINENDEQSPYCEVCGHCGEIGCCGIRNFIEEHIKGKTNCKNEEYIIYELIDLCEWKDKVFEENKQLKEKIDKSIEYLEHERFKRKILLGLYEKKYMKFIFNDLFEILRGDNNE